ncbi:hypothetical protein [Mucilaginibacter paludis]|uniref:Uncharacterized protein n=1 Tax=Mucilaginibacter paludis DSM 18603 TaxID=714943 RepID=H1YEM0_9SPHI|nr:hypothetical protein [Mucilaginibacter paludis]EHQ30780.1 hypothetical protein Mucpa_6731 [Mucilaginibacter paludis DSM 18603]
MKELPYFFNLLKNNNLISNAVNNRKLSDDDLAGLDYTRKDKNAVTVKNFILDEYDQFTEVFILMSEFGVLVDFITHDTKYFENAMLYFNTNAVARRKRGYIAEQKALQVTAKQINKFDIFSVTVHGAVMISEFYGCKIMTGFYAG